MIDADLDLTIDRIVDGGLSPAQLRNALHRLDAEPDGWKRCALAFLEAQTWGDVLREPIRPQPSLKIVPAPTARSKRVRPTLAAAAALVAFAMGWMAGGRDERPIVPAPTLATHDEPVETVAKVDAPDPPQPDPPPAIREVARLRLATGPDGESTADVPILAGPGLDSQWLMNQPMPVSDRERAALERQGYALDQERELVAMPLADGRQVVVPVDQVRLRYVGTQPL
ncbi:MAG: hypothetical protein P4L85_18040 [Paludisphaera borealis]|uniref:hypothetical protein n=1 Tax=Paludisphaera borealis TaxID=1387353 RepID=UPI0028510358|nr:hypothetical protein [Paludisphaera borealis]MDR3621258.1 hypothetical protein [Paludisphaera borealis]